MRDARSHCARTREHTPPFGRRGRSVRQDVLQWGRRAAGRSIKDDVLVCRRRVHGALAGRAGGASALHVCRILTRPTPAGLRGVLRCRCRQQSAYVRLRGRVCRLERTDVPRTTRVRKSWWHFRAPEDGAERWRGQRAIRGGYAAHESVSRGRGGGRIDLQLSHTGDISVTANYFFKA